MAKNNTKASPSDNPNLELYNKLRVAPDAALKTITAGNLKGKSDINPQWRIEILTTIFGPIGFGWYTEIKEKWTEREGNESAAWVRINLFVKDPKTGEWSKPIEGLGGSKQFGKGKGDGILNDEAFKMAETDAISVACKKLGVAADVYWDASTTKYVAQGENPQWQPSPTQQAPVQQQQAPAPQQMQQHQPGQVGYTKEQVIADLNSAKTTEELNYKWNYWAAGFGRDADVVRCIATHPYNPNNIRK